MTVFDHDGHWRSTWRTPVARMARGLDRARLAARVEIAVKRVATQLACEVFGHAFSTDASARPGTAGDNDMYLVLGDARDDLFVVCWRERAAPKAVAIHEQASTALVDFLARATSGSRDIDRIARWISGTDDEFPEG